MKALTVTLGAVLGILWMSPLGYGDTSTVIQQTTVQPVKKAKKERPVETTTITVTETETRQPLSEDTLKKISGNLCTKGFRAYVGTQNKNVCKSKAASPDIAYSCIWDSKGPMAFEPGIKGPCTLDFAEHQGKVTVTREEFPSGAPLKYGAEALCCFRAARGSP